jgi:hypothetical protein
MYKKLVQLMKENKNQEFKDLYNRSRFDGNFVEQNGDNLLTYCVRYNNLEVAEFIVYNTPHLPGMDEWDNPNPLDLAQSLSDSEIKQKFIDLFTGLFNTGKPTALASS